MDLQQTSKQSSLLLLLEQVVKELDGNNPTEARRLENLWHRYKVSLVGLHTAHSKAQADSGDQKRIICLFLKATDTLLDDLRPMAAPDDPILKLIGEIKRTVDNLKVPFQSPKAQWSTQPQKGLLFNKTA